MSRGEILADLNAEQHVAVTHAGGPLLVLAGPGSGKTRVVTRRVAYRIASEGVEPGRILGITFTNRAAEEMKSRLRQLLQDDVQVPIGTFHWMCGSILRRHIQRLDRRRDFRLLSPAESRRVLAHVANASSSAHMAGLAGAISAVKNLAPVHVWAQRCNLTVESLQALLHQYDARLISMNALDLDDLLRLTAQLLERHNTVRDYYHSTLEEILVDEYQDTNPIQHELLKLLFPSSRSLVVVGDEDQSIYGWRQADAQNVLRFTADFPNATVVKLERNYRSTKHIVRAANAVVRHNERRIEKAMWTSNDAGERAVCLVADEETDEAEWIAHEIMRVARRDRCPWSDFAVLFRVNAQSRAIEDALVRHSIPYQTLSGSRFYERTEIRRVVSYLRLVLDRTDDDAAEYLLLDVPGIGPKRLEALREIGARDGTPLLDVFSSALPHPLLSRSLRPRLEELGQRIQALRTRRDSSVAELVDAAIDASFVSDASLSSAEIEACQENLDELRSVVREFGGRKGTLRELVDRLCLAGDLKQASSVVNLLTLHTAKGLEFPVVFMPGLEEGLLPHRRSLEDEAAIEEERRLCYVGMTRAQRLLYLSYAHTRLLGGSALIGHPSRFIAEVGQESVSVVVSRRSEKKPRLLRVAMGERVLHSRWGPGTIELVEGRGRDTLVTILFDEVGQQRLQLCYAPLTRIQEEPTDVLAG